VTITDITVGIVKLTKDKGVKTSNFDMLLGSRNALEPYESGNKQDCYIYSVLHIMITEGK
jgi:hypothetical protein